MGLRGGGGGGGVKGDGRASGGGGVGFQSLRSADGIVQVQLLNESKHCYFFHWRRVHT